MFVRIILEVFWKTLKTVKMKILDSEMSVIATLKDLLSHYSADSDDADCSPLPSRGQRSCKRGHCRLYALTQWLTDGYVSAVQVRMHSVALQRVNWCSTWLTQQVWFYLLCDALVLSNLLLNNISCVPFTGSWAGDICRSSQQNRSTGMPCNAIKQTTLEWLCWGTRYICVNKFHINDHSFICLKIWWYIWGTAELNGASSLPLLNAGLKMYINIK